MFDDQLRSWRITVEDNDHNFVVELLKMQPCNLSAAIAWARQSYPKEDYYLVTSTIGEGLRVPSCPGGTEGD